MNLFITTLSPLEFNQHVQQSKRYYTYINTPAGKLQVLFTDSGIFSASFDNTVKALKDYSFKSTVDTTKLIVVGTGFQKKVWHEALKIPAGKTTHYQDIAQKIGNEKSHRAVANALGQNAIAYFIPCHRVIHKNGTLSGYRWGVEKKSALLNAEKALGN